MEVHLASEDAPEAPTTVGIVTWSMTAGAPTSATIQFGLTTDYGMEAPVDVNAEGFRTLLLGMKPERIYHFRIVDRCGMQKTILPPLDLNTTPLPHCNALAYNKTLAMYAVSDLTEDVYLFPRAGATPEDIVLLTSIAGPNSGWGGLSALPRTSATSSAYRVAIRW